MNEIQGFVPILDIHGTMIHEIGYRISGDAIAGALALKNVDLENEVLDAISRIVAEEPGNLRAGAVRHTDS